MGEGLLLPHGTIPGGVHSCRHRRREQLRCRCSSNAGKMSWFGQNFAKLNEDDFKRIAEEEDEIVSRHVRMRRKAAEQVELETVQKNAWMNFHSKVLGKLKGTHVDPEPGASIPYSKFWELLQKGEVNHIEYADYGKYIAAILPHYVNDPGARVKQKVKVGTMEVEVPRRPIVFKRHWVQQMPADAMVDVWRILRPQLKSVRVIPTNTIFQQIYPQLQIATSWGMRMALAVAICVLLETVLAPFLKFRNPDDRGWNEERDINAGEYILGAFGESRARFISAEEKTGITFDDFAGQDYIKEELKQIVKLLKENKDDDSVYIPKGVLLHGPPGTGKTLLARAIAGEAGLPFFSVGGSEFVEMYAGVAAARVKDLFSRARSFAPSIIFIDEIDAIGAKRGGPDFGGGGVEREQGLIQMLTELDGFQAGLTSSRVVVIGATNRLDMLDPALLRKGRFDKILPVGIPSEEGRLAILQVHAKNKPFRSIEERDQLLLQISQQTHHFSGAELANVLNEAVILSTRHDKDYIEKEELEEAIARQGGTFATGQEDAIDVTGEARTRLAYREAAVAVLECYYPSRHAPFTKTNIKQMTIEVNMQYAEPPEHIYAKKHEYIELAVQTCAPRMVEELIFGVDNLSWLSGTFLGEAGSHIDRLMFHTGMTALGKAFYGTTKDIIPHVTPKVQALREEYLRYAMEKCRAVLLEYRSALEAMADRLLEKSELEAAEIWDIFNKCQRVPQPDVLPVDEYGAIMEHGRWGIHGLSLPGRVTFRPGNYGTATFGAPKPIQVQYIPDEYWASLRERVQKNVEITEKMMETEEGREAVTNEMLESYAFADHL